MGFSLAFKGLEKVLRSTNKYMYKHKLEKVLKSSNKYMYKQTLENVLEKTNRYCTNTNWRKF
jgi:hypothetical protein